MKPPTIRVFVSSLFWWTPMSSRFLEGSEKRRSWSIQNPQLESGSYLQLQLLYTRIFFITSYFHTHVLFLELRFHKLFLDISRILADKTVHHTAKKIGIPALRSHSACWLTSPVSVVGRQKKTSFSQGGWLPVAVKVHPGRFIWTIIMEVWKIIFLSFHVWFVGSSR